MKKLLHDYLLQLSILALFIFLGMYTAVFHRGTSASTTTLPLSYEVKELKWSEYEVKQRAAIEEAFSPKNIEALKAQRIVELNARLAEEKQRAPFFMNRVEDYTTGRITVEKVVKEQR